MIVEKEIIEIKKQLNNIEELLRNIYKQLVPSETLPPARVYQLKEKARKKALEIKQKIETE